MKNVRILDEHVPLVRRVLGASDEAYLREVGERGEVVYLAEDNITQASVAIWDELIAAEYSGMRRVFAVHRMQGLRDALQPYVGKQLLRTGMWLSGRQYEIYVDPVTETVVHLTCGDSPDPEPISPE